MKKVSFYTLGCKVNTYDTTFMQELFINNDYEIVNFGEPCDIVVVNTCTVTGTADKKSRAIVRRAAKHGKVIVAGCMAQKRAQLVLAMDGVDGVIGTDERSKVVAVASRILVGETKINATHNIESCGFENMQVHTSGSRTRSTIKIQEGCNCFCSYCIIPYVRGRSRSKKLMDIINEATVLANGGTKEIVLTGIHIASYEDGENGLADVVLALDKLGVRIRLGSIDLGALGSEFVRKISKAQNLCPHFHLSLQSGSASVLKRMNRHYTPEEFMHFVSLLRDSFDNPAITTDVITGFPGETQSEFTETVDFTRKAAFSRLHVFPFSAREGTKAYDMTPKIPANVAKNRANKLIALGDALEKKYLASMQGKTDTVLFEENSREFEGLTEGYSSRYIRVAAAAQIGECRNVALKNTIDKTMQGELLR